MEGEAKQKSRVRTKGRAEQNAALQTRGGGRAGHRLLVPDDGVARPCSARFVCVSVKHGRFGFGGLCLASLLGGVGLDQLQPPRVPIAFELREPAVRLLNTQVPAVCMQPCAWFGGIRPLVRADASTHCLSCRRPNPPTAAVSICDAPGHAGAYLPWPRCVSVRVSASSRALLCSYLV